MASEDIFYVVHDPDDVLPGVIVEVSPGVRGTQGCAEVVVELRHALLPLGLRDFSSSKNVL